MLKLFFLSLCCTLVIACNEAVQPVVLDQQKMVAVLTDIRILEGTYASIVTKPDTLKPKMANAYQAIFVKHQINHDLYYASYDYYMAQPERMESIEDSVINRISDQLNRLQQPH